MKRLSCLSRLNARVKIVAGVIAMRKGHLEAVERTCFFNM